MACARLSLPLPIVILGAACSNGGDGSEPPDLSVIGNTNNDLSVPPSFTNCAPASTPKLLSSLPGLHHHPRLAFSGTGYVLPRQNTAGLPLTTVNLDKIKLRLLKVNERNLVPSIDAQRLTMSFRYLNSSPRSLIRNRC